MGQLKQSEGSVTGINGTYPVHSILDGIMHRSTVSLNDIRLGQRLGRERKPGLVLTV